MKIRSHRHVFIALGLLGAFVVGALSSSHAAEVIASAKRMKAGVTAAVTSRAKAQSERLSPAAVRAEAKRKADQARRTAAEARKKVADARKRAAAARERALLARVSRHGLSWPRIDIITSPFGPRRTGFHHGIDILCNPKGGEPIHAANRGRVIAATGMPVYGNAVIVEHPNHMRTLYAHLSAFKVRAGQTVNRGQVVGRCGTTGHSTAPHLHFEVYSWGRIINPAPVLPAR
jgi:murein DD-endopeptidase MepM/ murein hydrolase activator NlpD